MHHRIFVIVDEAETGRAATTENCAKAENDGVFLVALDFVDNEITDLVACRGLGAGVGDVYDELLAFEELVDEKLAYFQRGFGHAKGGPRR